MLVLTLQESHCVENMRQNTLIFEHQALDRRQSVGSRKHWSTITAIAQGAGNQDLLKLVLWIHISNGSFSHLVSYENVMETQLFQALTWLEV